MDSRIEKALSTFHNPHSCAQAVYAAFKDADEEKMASLKAKSSGRAPGGLCGALHAAILIQPAEAEEISAEFTEKTGSTICREIKLEHKTPCIECVKAAAESLAKRM